MEDKVRDIIDLGKILRKLLSKKKLMMVVLGVTFVLSCIIILMVPRYYKCEVILAPEVDAGLSGGTLGSIASQFGFDLGGASVSGSDAIYPMLYPDLFETVDFTVSLFDIKVETMDGQVKTDYYDYLANHQEHAPWEPAMLWVKRLFKHKPKTVSMGGQQAAEQNVSRSFILTEREYHMTKAIKSKIKCAVDKKTEVITISVQDQDPYVCATLADSLSSRLQAFITSYRTSKSRADMEYYQKLTVEAKEDYDDAVMKYSIFCDNHKDVILQTYISERDNLENDMQMKYNTYTALNTQLQAMKAKVQEKTPAFTVLQSASVPIEPAGPKRMLFVIGMMILALLVTAFVVVRKDLFVRD